jgi:hypothetical protein
MNITTPIDIPEPAPEPTIPVDFFDDGLLWAINAALMHPRGFALAVSPTGDMFLLGDGSEPWAYDRSEDHVIDAKFAAFEALLERGRATREGEATAERTQ